MPLKYAADKLDHCLMEQCAALEEPMLQVCRYALQGGRRTRGKLLLHAAGSSQRAMYAATALEMLHAATLLQDDIFDSSLQRRGKTAAHVQFGKAQSILASDWLLVRSLELAAEVHLDYFREVAGAATRMARTVATELQPAPVQEVAAAREQIDAVAQGKTAVLFALALRGAALLRPASAADPARWAQVGCQVGRVYQLLDDCLDVYATPEATGKEVGQDITTGRLTLPLLLAVEALRQRGSAIRINSLQKMQLTPAEIESLRQILQSSQVRTALLTQIQHLVQVTCLDAASVAVPSDAVRYWSADVSHKLQCCFGSLIKDGRTTGEAASGAFVPEAQAMARP